MKGFFVRYCFVLFSFNGAQKQHAHEAVTLSGQPHLLRADALHIPALPPRLASLSFDSLLHDKGICDQLECPSHVTVSSELYLIKYNYYSGY